MTPKRSQSSEGVKASRKAISLATKQAIIKDHNQGLSIKLICEKYSMARTTANTIIKNKEMLEKVKVTDSSTRFFKGRETIVEMERLLEMWIREKQMRGESVSQVFICKMAKTIFNELISESPSSSNARFTGFTASQGWFERFKKRSGIKSVVRHGETPHAHLEATKLENEFPELVEDENYISQQISNADETGTCWKKLPTRTYITKDETKIPDDEFMKDHFTMLNCEPSVILDIKEQSDFKADKQTREVDVANVQKFLQDHDREVNTTKLPGSKKLFESATCEKEVSVTNAQIEQFLECWETVKEIAALHPNVEETELNISLFEGSTVAYFKELLNERIRVDSPSNCLECIRESSTSRKEVPSPQQISKQKRYNT